MAITARDLSKYYHIYSRPTDRLKQMFFGRRRNFYRDFPAVMGVSFDVGRGETVGIVGRNGSGKSTLLQMICGTLKPTQGSVRVNGRIAALLELGSGFNPEFTGRENVYLNGAILGFSRKEMEQRFDSIAAFADIGEFLDHPVKTYSSGMYVRLAFATAINVDPDILVVDEALAVGDEAFRRKCFARIEQIKNNGATILFVSHSAQTIVQLCSRALLMDRGEVLLEGHPKVVINQYQRLLNVKGEVAEEVRGTIRSMGTDEAFTPPPETGGQAQDTTPSTQEGYDPHLESKSRVVYETRGAEIRDPHIVNTRGQRVNILEVGRTYTYTFRVSFEKEVERVGFGMLINTTKGIGVVGSSTRPVQALHLTSVKAGEEAEVSFMFKCAFTPSSYFINAGVSSPDSEDGEFLHRMLDAVAFHVAPTDGRTSTGIVDIDIVPKAIKLGSESGPSGS
ncbi:MAG: ABC transporter ATP-binding protein [Henriciella sp.]|nr:MAG: ABC transporter ATP-binding protein [Henriciella sp.]